MRRSRTNRLPPSVTALELHDVRYLLRLWQWRNTGDAHTSTPTELFLNGSRTQGSLDDADDNDSARARTSTCPRVPAAVFGRPPRHLAEHILRPASTRPKSYGGSLLADAKHYGPTATLPARRRGRLPQRCWYRALTARRQTTASRLSGRVARWRRRCATRRTLRRRAAAAC
jgi:hypothetical protein